MPALDSIPLSAFAVVVFTFLVARYVLFSAGAWFFVVKRLGKRFAHRKIQSRDPKRKDVRREIAYSIGSLTIFAATALVIYQGKEIGLVRLYSDVSAFGWGWTLLSLPLLLVLHDAYFWLTHRLLHTRFLFRHVHVVHHRSHNPTPFAAFAFHPVEAVIQSGFVLFAAAALPLHSGVLFAFVNLSLAINIVGHLGFEFYPAAFTRHPLGRWLTTSTHHNLHHQKTHGNYGLYFTWWDVAARSLRADYEGSFAAVANRTEAQQVHRHAAAARRATGGERFA